MGDDRNDGARWVDRVRIDRCGATVMEWSVEGDDSETPCDKIATTPQWRAFLEWREGVPAGDIVIVHTLSSPM
jgi:hypothetical protein